MGLKKFKLINKYSLTSDVFELVFSTDNDSSFVSGQFITFLLPKIGSGRAYSVLDKIGDKYYFIIKRLENGRGGSKEICDLKIGSELNGVGPTGNFVLNNNSKSKLFIGTGTGIVPLFNMIKNNKSSKIKLIWGNRCTKDLYYIKEINDFGIDYKIYLSQENNNKYNYGRVTDFLTIDNISNFEEFYICGNPNMVESVKEKLLILGISKDVIFTEKY